MISQSHSEKALDQPILSEPQETLSQAQWGISNSLKQHLVFLAIFKGQHGKTPLSTSPRVISGHLSGLRNLCVDWDLGVALSSAWDGVPWRARCTAWKINMEPEKYRGLEEFFSFSITIIFRFHVNFADCSNCWSGFLFFGITGHTGHTGPRGVFDALAQEMQLWEIADEVDADFALQAVGGEVTQLPR